MKTRCECCGNTYPNDDELSFHFWLVEAMRHGFVYIWDYQRPTFELSCRKTVSVRLKTKTVERTLLRAHTYTPDFAICTVPGKLDAMLPELCGEPVVYFDVKPKFEKYHSRSEAFRINQKWMFEKRGIFVHPVVPKDFFCRTWVPKKLAFCKNGKRREPFSNCRLVGEI